MAGIYSRKIYDECYDTEFINQQVNPGKYRTFNDFAENKNYCLSLGELRANKHISTGELGKYNNTELNKDFDEFILNNNSYKKEIESQLLNLDIPNSKCLKNNTLVEKNNKLAILSDKFNLNNKFNICDNNINYSRLDIPINSLRSVFINRYDFPIIEPNEFVYYGYKGKSDVNSSSINQINNERFGENTTLKIKDSISKPKIPKFSILLNQ